MSVIAGLFMHTAAVETFLGAGPTGDTYAAVRTVSGFLDDGVIRQQSAQGEQLVSRTVFYTDLANAAMFAPESRVTVNGRVAQVTQVRRRDGGPLLGPVSHVEVELT